MFDGVSTAPRTLWAMRIGSISPAFEWAQSGDWVYINAKMSHKLDAPATLNVVSEGVQMTARSLKFAASKDHKRFSLDLALHADINPDVSQGDVGPAGDFLFLSVFLFFVACSLPLFVQGVMFCETHCSVRMCVLDGDVCGCFWLLEPSSGPVV